MVLTHVPVPPPGNVAVVSHTFITYRRELLVLRLHSLNVFKRHCCWIVIVYSECLLRHVVLCVCAVLCVCFCAGHFVIAPLNLTCLHCLQHFF